MVEIMAPAAHGTAGLERVTSRKGAPASFAA